MPCCGLSAPSALLLPVDTFCSCCCVSAPSALVLSVYTLYTAAMHWQLEPCCYASVPAHPAAMCLYLLPCLLRVCTLHIAALRVYLEPCCYASAPTSPLPCVHTFSPAAVILHLPPIVRLPNVESGSCTAHCLPEVFLVHIPACV